VTVEQLATLGILPFEANYDQQPVRAATGQPAITQSWIGGQECLDDIGPVEVNAGERMAIGIGRYSAKRDTDIAPFQTL